MSKIDIMKNLVNYVIMKSINCIKYKFLSQLTH